MMNTAGPRDVVLDYLRERSRPGSHAGYIMQDGEWIPLPAGTHKTAAEWAYRASGWKRRKGADIWAGYERFIKDYRPVRVFGLNGHDFLFTAMPTNRQLEMAATLTIRDTPPGRRIVFVVWGATEERPGDYWERKFEKMIGRPLRPR